MNSPLSEKILQLHSIRIGREPKGASNCRSRTPMILCGVPLCPTSNGRLLDHSSDDVFLLLCYVSYLLLRCWNCIRKRKNSILLILLYLFISNIYLFIHVFNYLWCILTL